MSEHNLDDLAGWVGVLREGMKNKAEAEALIAVARQKIEDALGDADTGTIDGQPVVRWSYVVTNRLDTKLAKSMLTDAQVFACTVESETRRFALVT